MKQNISNIFSMETITAHYLKMIFAISRYCDKDLRNFIYLHGISLIHKIYLSDTQKYRK